MSTRHLIRFGQVAAVAVLLVAAATWFISNAPAGIGGRGAVGGVIVDAEGVLRAAQVDELSELRRERAKQLKQFSDDLNVATPLRKVSLRRLSEAYAARKAKSQTPLITEDMAYLAGLTRVRYVFVYPEEQDIVLVGPAEPIKVSDNGHMVGTETGQPILQLDHLLMAMRSAQQAARGPITCSIDPTPEGVVNFNRLVAQKVRQRQPLTPAVLRELAQAMGLQNVTLTGVRGDSDFARTMVAADHRMKRLAMGFDKSKVRGMRSYMSMIRGSRAPVPRFWMAPNYDALLRDADGLAWELRGPGIQVLTEDTIFAEGGAAQQTGKSSPQAKRWAKLMTEKYDELSTEYPVFGELRNVMDMAVIGALIVKEDLREKAGLDMSLLLSDSGFVHSNDFPVPKKTPTICNAHGSGRSQVVTASGGVEINSWKVVDRVETATTLSPVHKSSGHTGKKWWWN